MEKLIELFKEYVDNHGTDTKDIEKEYGVIDDGQAFLYGQRTYLYEILISKKFGMVKWLVENDKIDFEGKLNTIRFESLVDQTLDSYLALLMLLSISSSPIDDLILYLK